MPRCWPLRAPTAERSPASRHWPVYGVGFVVEAILNLIVHPAHAIGDVVKKVEGTKRVIKIKTR
ncbi:MAG: hypothetical protein ACLQU3_14395 [Limisphaerales bacterium]